MHRLTDFLAGFGIALLLHGLVVLAAAWFWTLRPLELRPAFQSGDASLAVTFVVADDSGRTPDDGQPEADSVSRNPEAAEILTDSATESSENINPTADDRRQMTAEARALNAETAAPSSVQASANKPAEAFRPGVSGAVWMQSEIRPYYPLGARLRGEEGAVTVRVWVQPSGRARHCEVARSSGYPMLDKAALDAARRARYVSTQTGAWRAESETMLTFRFRLAE